MPFSAQAVLAVLGPLFLILGAGRCLVAGRVVPDGKAWLLVGATFSVVAWWS